MFPSTVWISKHRVMMNCSAMCYIQSYTPRNERERWSRIKKDDESKKEIDDKKKNVEDGNFKCQKGSRNNKSIQQWNRKPDQKKGDLKQIWRIRCWKGESA